jgi:hypothetical protein
MKKLHLSAVIVTASFIVAVVLLASWMKAQEHGEQLHFEREESELIVANVANASLHLFKAGKNLHDTTCVSTFNGERLWLPRGNYFLQSTLAGKSLFMPAPIIGYRRGPEDDGSLAVTVRSLPREFPSRLVAEIPEFVYIPSGYFLLGDRLNPTEPHYVRVGAFFISPFEVSNAEFREFLNDPTGYADTLNWTEAGRRWKSSYTSQATALLTPNNDRFPRFGQPDQPVTWVTWFEATAFCYWLTKKIGGGRWTFSLPTEAEWEKVARGPDNFDYALSMNISDEEVPLYNWKKIPMRPSPSLASKRRQRATSQIVTASITSLAMSSNGRSRFFFHSTSNILLSMKTAVATIRICRDSVWRAAARGTAPAMLTCTSPIAMLFNRSIAVRILGSELLRRSCCKRGERFLSAMRRGK